MKENKYEENKHNYPDKAQWLNRVSDIGEVVMTVYYDKNSILSEELCRLIELMEAMYPMLAMKLVREMTDAGNNPTPQEADDGD